MMSSGRLFPSACCLNLASSLDSYLVGGGDGPGQGLARRTLRPLSSDYTHTPSSRNRLTFHMLIRAVGLDEMTMMLTGGPFFLFARLGSGPRLGLGQKKQKWPRGLRRDGERRHTVHRRSMSRCRRTTRHRPLARLQRGGGVAGLCQLGEIGSERFYLVVVDGPSKSGKVLCWWRAMGSAAGL
jgi:hypothetical protein